MGVEPEYGKVANVLPLEDRFLLNFDGNIVEAKTVIFAIGVAKAKELPGEKEFLGRGVSYCATCDGMLYRGKRAVVCGQADDLAEEANFLHDIGVQVTVVSRAPLVGLSEGIPVVQAAVQEIPVSYTHLDVYKRQVFNELVRGDDGRKEFFRKIIEVVTLLGGDNGNVL